MKNKQIINMWKTNCEIHKDKSTAYIISITAEMLGIQDIDVIDALSENNKGMKNEK